ncbi:peroxide stress protein YaaA [Leucobacter sp. UT-8R-CII-1-4]|uniref:YaaA family protein n=1 Tax=Leucobacter sp. UT-8R-CII-1-4 TaxID=3040075 RepID=UPI0024A88E4B|nr:peroxide stress protein YaaA [Leucobacter sp. UT-8R-CII-1-4]MDI6022020.1 peroxide stress protein YaaA [Leucobacter sp. UT-8R-CII-1-4]
MHILLPPSETKRSGGGSIFSAVDLAHNDALGETRQDIREALVALSTDTEAAVKALKLGVKNRDELLHNLALDSSGAMPAIDRYTGVLYDALDAASLGESSRKWLAEHVSVQSALFGLVRAGDLIPAYRLSGSSRLPSLSHPLKRSWSSAHQGIDWESFEWILDLRSKDYVALAPLPAGAGAWLHVAQRSPDGEVRALNHFNKAAKGDLVRRLAESDAQISGPQDLLSWAASQSLEASFSESDQTITLVTELGAPTKTAG